TLPLISADCLVRVIKLEDVIHKRIGPIALIVITSIQTRIIGARVGDEREAASLAGPQMEQAVVEHASLLANGLGLPSANQTLLPEHHQRRSNTQGKTGLSQSHRKTSHWSHSLQ